MHKGFVLVAVLLLIAGLMFAGGQGETGSKEESVQITLWNMMEPGPTQVLMKNLGKEFEEKHPNVQVIIEFNVQADYEPKLATAIASGTAPDIWAQSYRQVEQYVNNLDPIDDDDLKAMGYASMQALEDSWDPGALDHYTYKGKVYGFNWKLNIFAMAVNREHFREAGLDAEKDYPKYWDEVISVGKKLVKTEGGRIVRQAMTFPYNYSAIWYFMELQPVMRSMGGEVMNADGTECLINSEAGIQAMEHIKRRFTEGLIDKNISTTMIYLDGFPNGEFSMAISNHEFPIRWELANPDKMKGNVYVIMNPTTPGHDPAIGVSSWGHSVNNKSKHKDWAWRLVDWLTKDSDRYLIETGGIVPRRGWAETEAAADIVPQQELFAKMTKYYAVSGLTKDWTTVSEPIKKAMQEILYLDKDIRSTLNAVKKEVDNAIK